MTHLSSTTTGALLAMTASLFWTLAPFFFASSVRSLGSGVVNPLRLAGAAVILGLAGSVYALVNPTAVHALTLESVLWLAGSGTVGLVIGDAFYLKSLGYLGPRRTLQILVLAPLVSAVGAWMWLGEVISVKGIAGMTLTLSALVGATFLDKQDVGSKEPGGFSMKGYGIALLAVVFHGSAAILARKAYMSNHALDPALATAVRVSSSAVAIWIIVILRGELGRVIAGAKNAPARSRLLVATILGPVLGMIMYVTAFKTAPAGVVSLLSSLSPILIIPITAWRYKTKINLGALACVVMALAGVALVMVR